MTVFKFRPFNIKATINSILRGEKAKLRVLNIMDRALYRGWRATQQTSWTPKFTGLLMSMIAVGQPKFVSPTTAIGSLVVMRIEYGRRQEFEHRTKSRYLFRGIQVSQKYLIDQFGIFKKVFVPGNVTLKESDDEFRRDAFPTEINLIDGDLLQGDFS